VTAGPESPHRGPSDHAVEQLVGRVLQIGVLVAALTVLVGVAMMLARGGAAPAAFHTFHPETSTLRSVGGILRGARTLDSGAVVQLGLVLLVATPVTRVALTLVAFLLQRDRLYVVLTTVVLGLLLWGLVHGG
jgi:uncharacterized membrane protein